ncbi:hypothetical protein QBC44DRAFT_324383 [Cladorrhinum sp. PSN332]|nr:hypothetical protein QBC44DRAFT_324383 [Cladorrhinum sp. PSN332]
MLESERARDGIWMIARGVDGGFFFRCTSFFSNACMAWLVCWGFSFCILFIMVFGNMRYRKKGKFDGGGMGGYLFPVFFYIWRQTYLSKNLD